MEEKKKERKKTSSAKTLETAREAGYFGKKMLAKSREAVEEGRPIAWSMVDWWLGAPICKAMGIELVYPENWGAFCAATGAAEDNLNYSEMDGFPATLCGYARNNLGYARKLKENDYVIPSDAPGGGLPKPTFLLGCGAVCDARYKWFQSLGRYMEVPLWTLEFPQTGSKEHFMGDNKERNISFMVKELEEFVVFLEELIDKKMDWDLLEELLDTMFKTHHYAYEVDLMRKSIPTPMTNTDFWALMIAHLYLPEDKEALEFYKRVHEEVKYKVDNKIGAIPNEKYRMMFTELPPWHNLGFFDRLAERHGIVFPMESWNYHAPPPLPEEEKKKANNPLELIARYSYHKFHHAAPIAREHGIDPIIFTAPFLEYAPDYKIDGLMCHPLMSCRPATYTVYHVKNLLLEKFKIPAVVVEGDIVDLRVFNEEEAHSKVDAFIETMDYYRDIRKKEGFDW